MNSSSAFQRSWALLLAATIAGYPLVSALPLFLGVDNRVTSVPYRGVILLLSLRVLMLAVRNRRTYGGMFWLPFLVFWGLYTLRLLLDVIYWPAPLRLSGAEYFAYSVGMCMIPAMALLTRPSEAAIEMAVRWTLLAAAVACTIALYLNFSAIASGDLTSVESMRLYSETLTAISFGNLGVTIILISLYLLLRPRAPNIYSALGLLALVGLGLIATGLAASRGPVLAILLALPILVTMGFRNGARLRTITLTAMLLITGISGAFYIERTYGFGIISRIQSVIDFEGDQSSQERVQLYRDAWQQFLERPLLGNSLDERNSTFHPHNPVVESFMATGFVGGTAFCLLLVIGLAATLRLLRRRPQDTWIAIVFGQYLLHAMLSGSLYVSAEMWGLLSVVVALAYGTDRLTVPRAAEQPQALTPVTT